ncbi:MAG: hypothetical protein MZV70_60075 [Desulfobacterales bacterium]|nr:hypothetical protein [Desulfobacterales bacterium]
MESTGDAVCPCAASNDGHPGELLERRELEEQVQKCISALDDEYRESTSFCGTFRGFSYDEIRDVLQIPDGTVKVAACRARAAGAEGLPEKGYG